MSPEFNKASSTPPHRKLINTPENHGTDQFRWRTEIASEEIASEEISVMLNLAGWNIKKGLVRSHINQLPAVQDRAAPAPPLPGNLLCCSRLRVQNVCRIFIRTWEVHHPTWQDFNTWSLKSTSWLTFPHLTCSVQVLLLQKILFYHPIFWLLLNLFSLKSLPYRTCRE